MPSLNPDHEQRPLVDNTNRYRPVRKHDELLVLVQWWVREGAFWYRRRHRELQSGGKYSVQRSETAIFILYIRRILQEICTGAPKALEEILSSSICSKDEKKIDSRHLRGTGAVFLLRRHSARHAAAVTATRREFKATKRMRYSRSVQKTMRIHLELISSIYAHMARNLSLNSFVVLRTTS